MKKGQCKLKIYTHNFYEDGTEGEEERFISYYKIKLINQKEQNLFKGKHKKNKSLNIQNKDLNIKEIIQDNNKLNQTPLKKNNSNSKYKNFNDTYNHKDSNPESTVSGSINNKLSKSFHSQNFNHTLKVKKKMLNNHNLSSSKSPNNKKKINNQTIKNEKVSSSINDIIVMKEKINNLLKEENELEKQKYDIRDHFEYKLRPMRELNDKLILENKIIIDKEDELNGQLALLKNQYSQLINQLNEKEEIVKKITDNYEKEKEAFANNIQKEENDIYNLYIQAVEDLNNGKEVEIDDIF